MILNVLVTVLLVILYLILAVLALALLLAFLVLAPNIRYHVNLDKKNVMLVSTGGSWLFGLLRFKYRSEGAETEAQVKILFWKLYPRKEKSEEKAVERPVPEESKSAVKKKIRRIKKTSRKKIEKDAAKPPKNFFGTLKGYWEEINKIEDKRKLVKLTVKLTKRLAKKILPKKFKLEAEIGFEDPSHTGYALAASSLLRYLGYENVDVRGNFTEQKLDVALSAKGRFRLFGLLWPVVAFVFSRPVFRLIYKYIRRGR